MPFSGEMNDVPRVRNSGGEMNISLYLSLSLSVLAHKLPPPCPFLALRLKKPSRASKLDDDKPVFQ